MPGRQKETQRHTDRALMVCGGMAVLCRSNTGATQFLETKRPWDFGYCFAAYFDSFTTSMYMYGTGRPFA